MISLFIITRRSIPHQRLKRISEHSSKALEQDYYYPFFFWPSALQNCNSGLRAEGRLISPSPTDLSVYPTRPLMPESVRWRCTMAIRPLTAPLHGNVLDYHPCYFSLTLKQIPFSSGLIWNTIQLQSKSLFLLVHH